MARETGIYRRDDSRLWWIATTLPNGQRVRQSAGTCDRTEAEALLAQLKVEAFREANFGIKPTAHVARGRGPVSLRQAAASELQGRPAHLPAARPLPGEVSVCARSRGDVIWQITQGELKRGNEPATVNRYLATIRNLLRIARDEWQWIEVMPKIRLLSGEKERDRWLTQDEADRLIAAAAPHLQVLIRFALATGCRAREITGLEWDRVDLKRGTAWLDQHQEWHAARRTA